MRLFYHVRMGQIERLAAREGNYTIYGSGTTLDNTGRDIANILPAITQSDVLLVRPSDFFDMQKFDNAKTSEEKNAVNAEYIKAYNQYLEDQGIQNNVDAEMCSTQELSILNKRGTTFTLILQNYTKNEKPVNIIFMPDTPLTQNNTNVLLQGLAQNSTLEFKSSEQVNPKILQALSLYHEAGHIFVGHQYAGHYKEDVQNTLYEESIPDQIALRTVSRLQKDGTLPDDAVTPMLFKSARILATGYIPNNDFYDVHDTGVLLNRDGRLDPNANREIDERTAIAHLNETVYHALGASCRPFYDSVISTMPAEERGQYKGYYENFASPITVVGNAIGSGRTLQQEIEIDRGMKSLVSTYRPVELNMASVSVLRSVNRLSNEANSNLGYYIANNYPEIHYALLKAMLNKGMFDGNVQEVKIQKDYAESFIKTYENTVSASQIDAGLVHQFEREMNEPIQNYNVANHDNIITDPVGIPTSINANIQAPRTAALLPSPQ